jgi:hypothetical protein
VPLPLVSMSWERWLRRCGLRHRDPNLENGDRETQATLSRSDDLYSFTSAIWRSLDCIQVADHEAVSLTKYCVDRGPESGSRCRRKKEFSGLPDFLLSAVREPMASW